MNKFKTKSNLIIKNVTLATREERTFCVNGVEVPMGSLYSWIREQMEIIDMWDKNKRIIKNKKQEEEKGYKYFEIEKDFYIDYWENPYFQLGHLTAIVHYLQEEIKKFEEEHKDETD